MDKINKHSRKVQSPLTFAIVSPPFWALFREAKLLCKAGKNLKTQETGSSLRWGTGGGNRLIVYFWGLGHVVDSEEHITVPRDLRTDGQDTVSWLGLQGSQWPPWVPPLPGFLDLGGSCSESQRSFFPACSGPSHQQMITSG